MAVPWASGADVFPAPMGCVGRFGGHAQSGAVSLHSLALDFVLMWPLQEYSSTFVTGASWRALRPGRVGAGPWMEFSVLCWLTLSIAGIFCLLPMYKGALRRLPSSQVLVFT